MNKIWSSLLLLSLVMAGCTSVSVTDTETSVGSELRTEPAGSIQVTSSKLDVEASTLRDIEFTQHQDLAQDFERVFATYETTHYETKNRGFHDGASTFGAGLGVSAWLGYALYVDSYDPSFGMMLLHAFGITFGAGVVFGMIGGIVDPYVSTNEETERVGTTSESFQRTDSRTSRYASSAVGVSAGGTFIKRAYTDGDGRLTLSESELLEAGIHPVTLLTTSSLELDFEASSQSLSATVGIHSRDRNESQQIVATQAYQKLIGVGFRELIASQQLPVAITHQDQTRDFPVNVGKLPPSFFQEHYGRSESALEEAYGEILRNCQVISRDSETGELMHREVYRCLSNRPLPEE